MPPEVTCASALPDKTGKRENHIFTQLYCVTHTHNAPVCCLPERKSSVCMSNNDDYITFLAEVMNASNTSSCHPDTATVDNSVHIFMPP